MHPGFCFGLLALRNVGNRAQNDHAFLGLNRADSEFYRELAAVLPPGGQIPVSTHGSRCARGGKACPIGRGLTAKSLRYEKFDGLAKEFLASITEQFFGACVYQPD